MLLRRQPLRQFLADSGDIGRERSCSRKALAAPVEAYGSDAGLQELVLHNRTKNPKHRGPVEGREANEETSLLAEADVDPAGAKEKAIEVDWIWALARIHVGLRRWRKHVKEVLHARHRSLGSARGFEVVYGSERHAVGPELRKNRRQKLAQKQVLEPKTLRNKVAVDSEASHRHALGAFVRWWRHRSRQRRQWRRCSRLGVGHVGDMRCSARRLRQQQR